MFSRNYIIFLKAEHKKPHKHKEQIIVHGKGNNTFLFIKLPIFVWFDLHFKKP